MPLKDFLLFIDIEASGLPKKWNAPYGQSHHWPCTLQVAWVIFKEDGTEVKSENHYIENDGVKIRKSALKIHGITRQYLSKEGESKQQVLRMLADDLQQYSPLVIGHFIEFDYHVLSADYYRCGLPNPFSNAPLFCTMLATKGYLPESKRTFLKLFDIYNLLFNETLHHQHNAFVDARATAEVFFELKNRGHITDEQIKVQQPLREAAIQQASNGCSATLLLGFLLILVMVCFI